MKSWAICCPCGYCYVQSIDGGLTSDKKWRPHEGCPFGRSARTVLDLLLEACPTFSVRILDSNVTVAMGNFFTRVALLRSLATRDIFAVGTLCGNPTGLDGANALWEREEMAATERGDMLMVCLNELAIIKWMDSQVVHLMSTKHIFVDD